MSIGFGSILLAENDVRLTYTHLYNTNDAMLSFVTYGQDPYNLEVLVDDQGIDDLISYLTNLKKDRDHMHLIMGNELNDYPLPEDRKEIVFTAKHVRLEYNNSAQWEAND